MKSEQAAFGERLRAALDRVRMPHSATELSRLVERYGASASPQAVQKWLDGKSVARGANLRALAQALRVSADALYPGSTATTTLAESGRPEWVNAEDRVAIDQYLALPVPRRRLIRELIEALGDSR